MKRFIFYCLFLLCSCQTMEPDLGIARNYLPKSKYLTEGIASKYYIHTNSGPDKNVYTLPYYETMQLTQANLLVINRYNAGFEIERKATYQFKDNQMLLLSEKGYFHYDTTNYTISEAKVLNWEGNTPAILKKTINLKNDYQNLHQEKQTNVRDTMVLDKPAKIFEKELISKHIYQGDTSNETTLVKQIYVKDLGQFYRYYKFKEGNAIHELVEQMPLEKFKKMANHGQKRVAYIDPSKTMDQSESFKLCGSEHRIADYYNSPKDGRFSYGKQAMSDSIKAKVNSNLLFDESGYLTFRFVVNCKGEAARFITEQSDLNFRRKQFNQQTIDHLYQIIYGLKTWQPVVINNQPLDAYFYITFRLKDGKIVDILP